MRRATCCALLLMLVLCAAYPASAQQCDQGLERFQVELDRFINDLYAVADEMAFSGFATAPDFNAAVVEFDLAIADLSPEEMPSVCEQLTKYPILMDSPAIFLEAFQILDMDQERGTCLSPEGHAAILVIAWVAEFVKSAAAATCDTTGCTAGDLNIPGQIICVAGCIVAGIADFAAVSLQFGLSLDDDCQLNNHMDLLVEIDGDLSTRLDAEISSRASQESMTEVQSSVDLLQVTVNENGDGIDSLEADVETVHSSIDSDLEAISSDLVEQRDDRTAFQDLNLRLSIEQNLQPGQTGRISTFQLPRAVGGELELVREIVAETITMNQAAGQEIYNAFFYFDLGDNRFNSGSYREAFFYYRMAYQAAVGGRVGPSMGPS